MATILELNAACKRQHEEVLKKGFDNFHIPTLLMLTVSELGEALEADRKNRHANLEGFEKDRKTFIGDDSIPRERKMELYKSIFENHIKDTFEDEIADAFLRLMDLVGAYDIDIEKHIRYKQIYNGLRPTKHGKAY